MGSGAWDYLVEYGYGGSWVLQSAGHPSVLSRAHDDSWVLIALSRRGGHHSKLFYGLGCSIPSIYGDGVGKYIYSFVCASSNIKRVRQQHLLLP